VSDIASTAVALVLLDSQPAERAREVAIFEDQGSYWLTPPAAKEAGNTFDLRTDYMALVGLGRTHELAGLVY
jgi:hypothetical protein